MPKRNKPTPKMLEGLVIRRKDTGIHAEFSERAHLLRWCHERSLKELKALRKAFESARSAGP